jgi:hypothetical protein
MIFVLRIRGGKFAVSRFLCRSLVRRVVRRLAERKLAHEVIALHECAPDSRCAECRRTWPCPMRLCGEEALVVQRWHESYPALAEFRLFRSVAR